MRVGALLLLSYFVLNSSAQPSDPTIQASLEPPPASVSSHSATIATNLAPSPAKHPKQDGQSLPEEAGGQSITQEIPTPSSAHPPAESTPSPSPLDSSSSSVPQSSPSPTSAPVIPPPDSHSPAAPPPSSSKSPLSSASGEIPPAPRESASESSDSPDFDPLPSPAFLSFDEWKKKFAAAASDSGPPRRSKKVAQRARQDAVGGGGGSGAGEGSFDADGVDLGTLFGGEEESDVVSDGQLLYDSQKKEERLDSKDGKMRHGDESTGEVAGKGSEVGRPQEDEETNGNKTVSPIQPLPNVGTGDSSDPLLQLKDRSNYALFECAAMVHRSSHLSKGASSILVEKKDRYMLTPCSAPTKFVELELCDEIKIDTVVLSNFEFFSSMFKHFTIKVSVNYPGKKEEWQDLGTFRARNIRGVQVRFDFPSFLSPNRILTLLATQVFHPKSIPGFYRYMRIDFLSHYGSEYYCPVSLLRVYGLTQMDAYRKDEEARVEMEASMAARAIDDHEEDYESELHPVASEEDVKKESTVEVLEEMKMGTPTVDLGSTVVPDQSSNSESSTLDGSSPMTPASIDVASGTASDSGIESSETSNASTSSTATVDDAQFSLSSTPFPSDSLSSPSPSTSEPSTPPPEATTLPSATIDKSISSSVESPTQTSSTTSSVPSSATPSTEASTFSTSSSSANSSSTLSNEAPVSGASPTASVSIQIPKVTPDAGVPTPRPPRNETRPPPPPVILPLVQPTPGESIYATIMKRLSTLERNQTLSMHYIEAQSQMIRDIFTRVEKRLGDAESTVSFLLLLCCFEEFII